MRAVIDPPQAGTVPTRVSYDARVGARVSDDAANGSARASSPHLISDAQVRRTISSGSRTAYPNGYVQYDSAGVKNGRAGSFEVGGHWYKNNRFYVTHRFFAYER
jgi:hypothetical protein